MLQVRIKKKLGNFLLDVDFSMDGGIFAILGASGCGKSMTLKCIAGIERPDEGRIVLNDRVLFDSAKRINLPPNMCFDPSDESIRAIESILGEGSVEVQ